MSEAPPPNEHGVWPHDCPVMETVEVKLPFERPWEAIVYVVKDDDGAWRSSYTVRGPLGAKSALPSVSFPGYAARKDAVLVALKGARDFFRNASVRNDSCASDTYRRRAAECAARLAAAIGRVLQGFPAESMDAAQSTLF